MSVNITILGCGNSDGVPAIGNHWGACDPLEPKNRRTRPSIAVQSGSTTLVIDTGPDFREQMNRENIRSLDAVLYTHAHGDHISGVDDLRGLAKRSKTIINIYGNEQTLSEIRMKFEYQFIQKSDFYPAVLTANTIEAAHLGRPMVIGDIEFTPFEQEHGPIKSLGFRFGDLAYSTDLSDLPEESIRALSGIHTWIVDAAGYKMPKNSMHLTLERLYALNERVQARQVWLTHLPPGMDYASLLKELPEGYAPLYDGLKLTAGDH